MDGRVKEAPLPKISHTYLPMMKLGKVILYLKKIQKIYKSRDTSWVLLTSAFFVISRNTNIDCILTHKFQFLNFFLSF